MRHTVQKGDIKCDWLGWQKGDIKCDWVARLTQSYGSYFFSELSLKLVIYDAVSLFWP